MAIGTNDAVYKHGTNTEVIATSGTLGDGTFSTGANATTFTNTADAPIAQFVFDGTLGSAPANGVTVDLYVQLLNASSTSPTNAPSASNQQIYLGSFLMDGSSPANVCVIGPVGLPSLQTGQTYDFYIQNNAGVTLNPGATVDIVPLTYGPAA